MTMGLHRWVVVHALCMLAAVGWTLFTGDIDAVLFTGAGSFLVCGIIYYPLVRHLSPPGGVPNLITLFRLALFVALLLSIDDMHNLLLVAGVVVVLIADGLDGYFARRLGQSTELGALFDMEVDAFIGCALALTGYLLFELSEVVIAAGAMRYAFVLFRWGLSWSDKKVKVPGARTFAILFFVSLLTPFVFGAVTGYWLTVTGSALVLYSFARETILLGVRDQRTKGRT